MFVFLPELLLQVRPGDQGRALSGVTTPVKKDYEVLELRLLAGRPDDLGGDGNMMSQQVSIEELINLNTVNKVCC